MNQELKNALAFLIDLGKLASLMAEKKGLDSSELPLAQALFMEAGSAFSGLSKALDEAKSLSPEEAADLAGFVMEKLSISDPKTANILAKGIAAALADFAFVKALKA